MSQNEPGSAGSTPEIWHLTHPEHGALEVAVGRPDELRTLDEGYPDGGDTTEKDTTEKSRSRAKDSVAGAIGSPGYVVLRDGGVIARARKIGDHKISIDREPPAADEFAGDVPVVSGPRIQIRSNAFDTAVRQVTFRHGKEVVHFDPPPGSAAEARLAAIAASPWKRVVYPIAGGVGKSGWAIAAIVLLPLLGRLLEPVLDWVLERLPDVEIPWPDTSLPEIPWPDIDLPEIPLPDIDLPEITLPGWVEFLLEYSKVWVPLVVGIGVAVVAVQHSRRSRRIKEAWNSDRPDESRDPQPDESRDPQPDGSRDPQPDERRDDRPDENADDEDPGR